MITIFNEHHALHHGVELNDGVVMTCWESPSRAELVLERVRAADLGNVIPAVAHDEAAYARVHGDAYLRHLVTAWPDWCASGFTNPALPLVWPIHALRGDREPRHIEGRLGYFAMDAGCSIAENTWQAVRGSADTALTGAAQVLAGAASAFALCRPPGHHAGRNYMGGYCYLNNAAIAAQALRDGGAARVAALDVDFHHGNGTQDVFYDRGDVFFASLHGDPRVSYPYFLGYEDERGAGPGLDCTANFPLQPGTTWETYAVALQDACTRIRSFGAEALVVSLGVDTFVGDPISSFALQSEDYLRMGAMIARLDLPTLFVFEGGYAVGEIGVNVVNTLLGFESR